MERNEVKHYLISEKQHAYLFKLLYLYLNNDKKMVQIYVDRIQKHYDVPSTWQLTKEESTEVIGRMKELVDKILQERK